MPVSEKAFIDTTVLLYLLSDDADKADRAEAVIRAEGLISVQVLNELTSVARRKLSLSWVEINEILTLIGTLCQVEPLTVECNQTGRLLAERYSLSVYDAMIVASALLAGCDVLYSEDMQDGLVINEKLRISNPFDIA